MVSPLFYLFHLCTFHPWAQTHCPFLTLAPILMNLICISHSNICTLNHQFLFMKNRYDFEFFCFSKKYVKTIVLHIFCCSLNFLPNHSTPYFSTLFILFFSCCIVVYFWHVRHLLLFF